MQEHEKKKLLADALQQRPKPPSGMLKTWKDHNRYLFVWNEDDELMQVLDICEIMLHAPTMEDAIQKILDKLIAEMWEQR